VVGHRFQRAGSQALDFRPALANDVAVPVAFRQSFRGGGFFHAHDTVLNSGLAVFQFSRHFVNGTYRLNIALFRVVPPGNISGQSCGGDSKRFEAGVTSGAVADNTG